MISHTDYEFLAFSSNHNTERIDIIQTDEPNNYFREETKDELRRDSRKQIRRTPDQSHRDNQSLGDKQKEIVELKPYIHRLFCKRDCTRFTSKYEFMHGQEIKF